MKTLILALFLAIAAPLFGDDDVKKVVVELTSGDINDIKGMISGLSQNAEHYVSRLEELEAAVVIHGDAYKFFMKDLAKSPYAGDKELAAAYPELTARLKTLVEMYDVQFDMCNIGMQKRGITKEMLHPFVTPVFSSLSGLVDRQSDGYTYFRVE